MSAQSPADAAGKVGRFQSWWREWPVRTSDWPFSVKMTALPILATAFIVSLGVYGSMSLARQADLIRAVVQQDLLAATTMSDSASTLRGINGRLYRLLALQAAHVPGFDVQAATDSLATELSTLSGKLSAFRNGQSETTHTALDRILGELDQYRDTVLVVGSMLDLDFSSAVELVRPFDQNAERMLTAFSDAAAKAVDEARERANHSEQIATRATLTFVVCATFAAALLSIASRGIANATVRSVKEIAEATLQVVKGDQNLMIAKLARRDELGIIVDSLGAFQANVARVNFLAHHDPLTTLPNRVTFQDRIGHAVAHAARGRLSAILCLDLDHFKAVNDTLGHAIGDALLQMVAERLMRCVRETDLVARLGGDEFAIIQADIASSADAGCLAQRVVESVSAPYAINGQHVCIGVSVGIAVLSGATENTAAAMKNADLALYQAKASGRGTFCYFDPSMNESLQARRALELDLRLALSLDQFVLFYQPLVGIASGQVSGFEALLRWRHPTRGLVSPLEFIPICEETGMIHKIGAWVIDQACRDAMRWPGHLNVAVNLSAVQFKNADLVAIVSSALAASGLAAQRLELEITESVLLLDSEATLATLHQLRALDLRISMDDFGTGYSSLSYLQSFPFDKIKIDQSFVRNLTGTGESVAIIRAVTGLSRSLGIETVAEGVETHEQLTLLRSEACTEVQGYLFGRPCPAGDIPNLLDDLAVWQPA